MAFCPQCGAQIEENAQFCGACGALQGKAPAPAADTSNDKLMGVLAYLSILVLVPIFAAKDSRFARFHANQGLVLLIADFAYGIVSVILGAISVWFGVVGLLLASLLDLVNLVFLALTIIGIVNVVKYEEKELPLIGKFRILK